MRSAVIAAAFAAVASAVPYEKRDVVTHTEMNVVYHTAFVTVTGGAAPAAPTPEPVVVAEPKHHNVHFGGKPHKHHSHPKPAPKPAYSPAPQPEQPAYSPQPKPQPKPEPEPEPSTPAPSNGGSKPTTYSAKAVTHHNLHRFNHSAPAIEWDDNLAGIAAEIASSCTYAHNTEAGGGGYGQNIAAGVASDNITAVITNLFYNAEIGYYDSFYGMSQPPMTNFEQFGHFTQMIWQKTTHVGCHTQDCSAGGLANTGGSVPPYFTVCNYKSAGNFAGEYAENIKAPLGHPTAEWDTDL